MLLFKKVKDHDGEIVDSKRIINDTTPFAVKEAFRSLYTNIRYIPIESKCKKFAITSAYPGEGKTYTSINLAITIAENSDDKKVLLLDLDMRKSTIAKLFKEYVDADVNVKNGIAEYLTGISETPNVVETKFKNLSVFFAGKDCINPAGLITSAKFNRFLEECNEKYDYIIIDTPPVMVVSDAALLNNAVDGYFISTRSDHSTTTTLSAAIESLNKVGANIFGIIFTDEQLKKFSKYSRYNKYSSYSSYSSDDN